MDADTGGHHQGDAEGRPWADRGGGGGPDPPFGPKIGPKIGPPSGPPYFCLYTYNGPPFQKSWMHPCHGRRSWVGGGMHPPTEKVGGWSM